MLDSPALNAFYNLASHIDHRIMSETDHNLLSRFLLQIRQFQSFINERGEVVTIKVPHPWPGDFTPGEEPVGV